MALRWRPKLTAGRRQRVKYVNYVNFQLPLARSLHLSSSFAVLRPPLFLSPFPLPSNRSPCRTACCITHKVVVRASVDSPQRLRAKASALTRTHTCVLCVIVCYTHTHIDVQHMACRHMCATNCVCRFEFCGYISVAPPASMMSLANGRSRHSRAGMPLGGRGSGKR